MSRRRKAPGEYPARSIDSTDEGGSNAEYASHRAASAIRPMAARSSLRAQRTLMQQRYTRPGTRGGAYTLRGRRGVQQVPVEQITDPAAGRIIADLRRRLDEVEVVADLSAARHAEAEVLRRRLDAVLAARHSEVSELRRRIMELEARVLAADGRGTPRSGSTAPHPSDGDGRPAPHHPPYSELAAGFRERLGERTADLERRYEERFALLRQVLEEKDEQIRRLTEQLAAALRELERLREPAAPQPPDPRDLERIRGIGPVIAATLRSLGITTLHQVAALSDAELDRIDAHLDAFPGRARRDRWVQQAADLLG